MENIALIMAGGVGAKLWPRSREKHPKQFTHIIGEGTLIQNAVARLSPLFSPENIHVVTGIAHASFIREQLPFLPPDNIFVEPYTRNTAPCVGLSAELLLQKYSENAVLSVFPSDHLVINVGEFQRALEVATLSAVEMECIMTLGVPATRPETAYGYIQVQDEQSDISATLYEQGVRHISTFAEKPDVGTAGRFLKSGDFLWNTGIFTWKLSTLFSAYEKYLPDYSYLFKSLRKHIGKSSYSDMLHSVYRQMRAISLDYGIMENADNVLVKEGGFGWNDVGSWDEVYRLSMKDRNDNAIEGDVIAVNTRNCYVSAREKLIAIVGLEDIVVVDSDDALLICKRGASEETMEIVDFMRRKQINKFL